jgi:heterotetrameric sarcosine oxidase delta subunit
VAIHLSCPNCGTRPYTEFWFHGEVLEAEAAAPQAGSTAALDADYERVWTRRNSAGVQREAWFHFAGCRRLLHVERDTLTNEVHVVD